MINHLFTWILSSELKARSKYIHADKNENNKRNIYVHVCLFHFPLGLFSEMYNKIKGYGIKQKTQQN